MPHRDVSMALRPTILFKAAGTRPLPAVSVPKEKVTCQGWWAKPTRWGDIIFFQVILSQGVLK